MNYVVLDLEWNQSNTGLEEEVKKLPFEIIEIGAVKLTENSTIVAEFSELVKPQVYQEMHHITSKLINLHMQELERGKAFPVVAEQFLDWCGEEEYMFCSWGSPDLTELQRNMNFYHMTPLSDGPIAFLDVQKLFAIAYEDRKHRRSLEYAIDFLEMEKDIPFHRAFSDAYYTAKILALIIRDFPEVLENVSYDVFQPPLERKREIRVRFDTYEKYISRVFADKTAAFADREVSSSKCYICHKNLRKKVRWFAANTRHYYCLAYCDKHGYLRGKIRVHKTDEGVFVVKTTKLINDTEMEAVLQKQLHAKLMRQKKRMSQKKKTEEI